MKNANLRITLLVAALGAAFPLCAQTLDVKIGHVAPLPSAPVREETLPGD